MKRRVGPALTTLASGLTLALALALVGCTAEEPLPSLSLLPLAHPVAADGGTQSWRFDGEGIWGAWSADREHRLRLDGSERVVVLASPRSAWEVPVELRPGDRLRWALSALRPAAGESAETGTAGRLSLVDAAGEEVTLGRFAVSTDGWTEREVVIEEAVQGRLRLVGEGGPVAWSGGLLTRAEPAEPSRPNLMLVSADTLRADRLAAYGAERPVAPHLDRLAADSLVFRRSLSTSTWTLPSHASMFTGLLPGQHGLVDPDKSLADRLTTVAERLRAVGYHTMGITDGGFLHPRWGLAAGFDTWTWTRGHPWEPKNVVTVVERARRWMEANRYEPYFLFVHSYEAHQPYVNREGFADPFLEAVGLTGADAPRRVNVFEGLHTDPADKSQRRRVAALYDGGVARLDHHLGGWLAGMAEAGDLDDVALVVTSDHGEELGEHGGYEHGEGKVFDENVLVPMLVRAPAAGDGATEARSGTVATPITSIDVAPTLLAWAGVRDPGLPGESLVTLARAGDVERPAFVHGINSLQELHERRFRLDPPGGQESLIFDRPRGVLSLFDRASDPRMQRPWRLPGELPTSPAEAGRDAVPARTVEGVARLQTILGWVEAAGQDGNLFAARLPDGVSEVAAPTGSAAVPQGAFDGLVWRPAEDDRVHLASGWPALLGLTLQPGPGPRRLVLTFAGRGGVGAGQEMLQLRPARFTEEPGWNPIFGRLPAPGELFRASRHDEPTELELDDEARQELRALGYLR